MKDNGKCVTHDFSVQVSCDTWFQRKYIHAEYMYCAIFLFSKSKWFLVNENWPDRWM